MNLFHDIYSIKLVNMEYYTEQGDLYIYHSILHVIVILLCIVTELAAIGN